MIQAENVLGSHCDDIKNILVRTDFDTETLKSFSAAGIDPPVSEAEFTGDLYFFSYKIERHKVGFLNGRIDEIVFITGKDRAVAMINDLAASEEFEFKPVTKRQREDTPFEMLSDHSAKGMNFLEIKIQRFESGASQFNVNNIHEYACLTFRSDAYTVVIQQECTENDRFFIFELRPLTVKNN